MSRPDPRALIEEARERHGYLEALAHLAARPAGAESLRRIDALLVELADALEAELPDIKHAFPLHAAVRVIGNVRYTGIEGVVTEAGPDADGWVSVTLLRGRTMDDRFRPENLELL